MRRTAQRKDPDVPVMVDLDQRFAGVDERSDTAAMPGSTEVQEGARVTAARNVRFAGGSIETRDGYSLSRYYNPVFVAGGEYMGAGRYIDATGKQWLLSLRERVTATAYARVYHARENGMAFYTSADAAMAASGGVLDYFQRPCFVQLGNDCLLFRSGDRAPLLWDGEPSSAWVAIAEAEPSPDTPSYMKPLPPAEFAVSAGERLVFPYEDGRIGWTDILEPRRWDAATSWLRVGNDGGAITGLALWRNRTLIVFKERSVWAVDNWFGDLSEISLQKITDQTGCVSHRTITQVGGELIWLGQGGVYRLQQVLDTVRELSPVPVSWLIPKSMARVNWTAAVQSSAALARGIWTLAVPVDGSAEANHLLVWDARTNEWQGEDRPDGTDQYGSWAAGPYMALVPAVLHGRESLALVQKKRTLVMGSAAREVYFNGSYGVTTRVQFRGYSMQDMGLKRLERIEMETSEHGTSGVTLQAAYDGNRTTQTLQSSTTRNRAKWLVWGRGDRDLTNADNDFDFPEREDYSLYGEDELEIGSAGITLGTMQSHRLAGAVSGVSRLVAPIVTASGGRLRINTVRAAGIPVES